MHQITIDYHRLKDIANISQARCKCVVALLRAFSFFIMGKMFFLIVDLIRSRKYGLNSTESNLCSVFNFLLSRKSMNVDGEEYYMADYDYVSSLCYLLPDKKDTLQRLYKRIENVGLVKIMKIGKHLYINPSDDMRDWGNQFDNIESGISEKNPIEPEKNPNETEKNPKNTEKNPCPILYNNNINNKQENNKKEEKEISENIFSLSTELSISAKEISVDTRVFKKVDNLLSSVVFPFDEIEFKKKFFVLCCMPKWRTKTIHAIQMQLNKLQEYELDFVMELIDNSIMNEWQGIVYQDTPKRYQEWLRTKSSGNRAGGIRQITDQVERDNMMQYLNKDSDLWK